MESTDRTTFLASLGAVLAAAWTLRGSSPRQLAGLAPAPADPSTEDVPAPKQAPQITPPAHSVKRRG